MDEQLEQRLEYENERTASQQAASTAAKAANRKVQKRLENPEFFQQLRDPDVDSEKFDWVEQDLGPLFSGAHLIGNRDEQYEREAKWTNMAEAERIIAEGKPGRLCKGPLLEIAQQVHRRPDKSATDPYSLDERRVIRDAFEASTSLKSLSVDAKGLESVTTATAVHKTETNEETEKSMKERGASFLS
jgi:hypothetical protein